MWTKAPYQPEQTWGFVLKALLMGGKRKQPTRINWDIAPHRDRLTKSWTNKTDLYRAEESFTRFCTRNHINRIVLKRYMDRLASGEPAKKWGRPTLLSHDVMRHICEGIIYLFLLSGCLLVCCLYACHKVIRVFNAKLFTMFCSN